MKKLSYLLLLPLIFSCSLNSNLNTSSINTKNSFKIKGAYSVQDNDFTYNGTWDTYTSSNYNGNNMTESNGVIENTNSSLVYSGSWTNFSNGLASASSFHYTNSEAPFQMANDTSSSITYIGSGWLTYSPYTYNELYNVHKYVLTNQETDIGKITYSYTGTLGGGPKNESWSLSSMHPAWRTLSSGGTSYTESRESTSKIEIPFTGTNIQVYQFKTSLMGQCRLKVYDSSNNEIRNILVNNYNPTFLLSRTTITGLPNGSNRLVIEGIDGHRFNFVRAEVLPSIEYKFYGNNIIYNALKWNNCGKIAVTIDNSDTPTIIDLYNATAVYEDVFVRRDLGSGEHTITIDPLEEKNTSSSGFRFSVNEFKARPAVRGSFIGTYLNLKLVKLSNYGKADLYIDGVWNQEIDLYNSSTQFFDLEITGLTNTTHTFYIEAKNQKNPSSSGNRVSFDSYTTNKAEYEFQGISLYYYATKGPDKGQVDIYLDGNYQGRFDLYSATEQYQQEIFHITGLSNTTHTLKLIPSGRKRWHSTNYKVNVDYLQIGSTPRVIYSGYDGSNYDIYVTYEDNSSTPLKISTGSGNGGSPAIAINGNQAVWTGFDGTNYYVKVGSTTNDFSPIIIDTTTTIEPKPVISQDGSKVAWIKNASGANVYVRNSDNSNSAIHISTTSSSNKDVNFSPDSNKVVWVGTSGTPKVFVRNSDGSGTPTEISGSLSNNQYPIFSYDGTKVAWKGTTGSIYNIYTGNADGSGSPIQISTKTSNTTDYPMFSPDNTKVVYSAITGGTYHIFTRNTDGSGSETQISDTSTTLNLFPTFSPDGSKIAWHGRDSGSVFHIYVRNSDGSGSITKISGATTNNFNPSFSPDGSKILWVGQESGINHVYVRNSDGSGSITKLSTTTTDNQKALYEGARNRF